VSFDGLTRDNTLLSRPTIEPSATRQAMIVRPVAAPLADSCRAGDCKHSSASAVEAYVEAGIAPVTLRAYRTDLNDFEGWGGTLPATDAQVANTSPITPPS